MSEYDIYEDFKSGKDKVLRPSASPCGERYAKESELAIACQKVLGKYSPEEIEDLLDKKNPPKGLQMILLRSYYFKVERTFRGNRNKPYLDVFQKKLCKKAMMDPLMHKFFDINLIFGGKRNLSIFLEKISNAYEFKELIFEYPNDFIINRDIYSEFIKFADSNLISEITPGYSKIKKNPEKLTRKTLLDILAFNFFDNEYSQRKHDISFKLILSEIRKYKKWKSFVFKLSDSHVMPENIKQVFLNFYNHGGESSGQIQSTDLPPFGESNSYPIREPKKKRVRQEKPIAKPPEFFEDKT